MAVNFFNRRRNIALALTGIYRPISGALIIQAFSVITVLADWRMAFRLMGVLSLFVAIPMIVIMRRRPEDIGMLPDGARPTASTAQSGSPASARGGHGPAGRPGEEVSWTSREGDANEGLLDGVGGCLSERQRQFRPGVFSLVPYLHEFAGLTTPQAAGVLSVSTFLALSSLVWGQIAGRLTPRWCIVAGHGGIDAGDAGAAAGQLAGGGVRLRGVLGACSTARWKC